MAVLCNYCDRPARLVPATTIYGPTAATSDYAHKRFWHCAPCDAYVGTHGMTTEPLGTLANAPLRAIRKRAHDLFDRTWRNKGKGARAKAYRWLSDALEIEPSKCHIGMMDEIDCRRVIGACSPYPAPTFPGSTR